MMDYPRGAHLKCLGRAEILSGIPAVKWIERLRQADYPAAVIERVYLIPIEACDWNCSQHITPRWTHEEIQGAMGSRAQ